MLKNSKVLGDGRDRRPARKMVLSGRRHSAEPSWSKQFSSNLTSATSYLHFTWLFIRHILIALPAHEFRKFTFVTVYPARIFHLIPIGIGANFGFGCSGNNSYWWLTLDTWHS
jgi:hypothetical protein